MERDVGVGAREQSLIGERLAGMWPLEADGAFSTAQKANARGFARKMLARELGLWAAQEPSEHDDVAAVLRPRRRGRSHTPAERAAIASRAVHVATEVLENEAWSVLDVGATHSYDLHCSGPDGSELFVEVKGTTGPRSSIVLTANEVELARSQYPNTALFVVYGIRLSRNPEGPHAIGGQIHPIRPWRPDDSSLTPTAYSYWLGA
jgi:hypothetical protein